MDKTQQLSMTITAGALIGALRDAIRTSDLYSDNQAQSMFRTRGVAHAVEAIGRAFEEIDSNFNRDRFRSDCGLTPMGLPKKSATL